MADTTSLSALPLNNNVQNSENITLQTTDKPQTQGQMSQGQMSQGQTQGQTQGGQEMANVKQANPPQYVPPNSQKLPPPQLTEDMIRLSVGLEDINDIKKDFERGFKAVKKLNK